MTASVPRSPSPVPAVEAVRTALFAARDTAYRDFQCSLMPTVNPSAVIGVRTPVLRKLAKDLRRTDPTVVAAFLADLPHAYFEENQLHAFLIEDIRPFAEALAAVEAFLPFIDNWATCDQCSPRAFKGHLGDLLPCITRWMADDHPYTVRYGIGMLMRYGLDGDFDPCFLSMAADPAVAEREAYYIRMMVAWFFATALAKQYEVTLPYLTDHRLPAWTHNKTIQKACESYRVPEAHKAYLRSLRVKERMAE